MSRHQQQARERGLEWLSSIIMVAWGIILAQPGDTLSAANFSESAAHGVAEDGLAYVFGALGGVRLAALYINGRWPRTPLLRMIGAGAGLLLWGQIASMFGTSYLATGNAGTGFAAYGCLAMAEIFSIYWAAFDARYNRP
ncbi:hypothetical protein [Terrihabitans rhizophilus]|uniref:DUF4345 domain-containing protein n=1 Tax=Terrihabitans rhizophilus TaxID=3092662 RepID=A0ABU4RP11_9HYPH|nr:hypothetical protein [Terrihabitans sp. PJ23]MDX6806592.1 hypothetical protein [Terrihabitans sp. PJ23]